MFRFFFDSDSPKFRLSHSEVNYLTHQLIIKHDPAYQADRVDTFHTISVKGMRATIFPMCKDSSRNDNQPQVPFFKDKVKEYLNSSHRPADIKEETLVIPLLLCRGFGRLPTEIPLVQRMHSVLMMVDVKTDAKTNVKTGKIHIHDSQNAGLWAIYLDDHFYELEKQYGITHAPEDYHTYGVQFDNYSCGYYIIEYLKKFLECGNMAGCKDIHLNIKENYLNKNAYLKANGVNLFGEPLEQQPQNKSAFELEDEKEIFSSQVFYVPASPKVTTCRSELQSLDKLLIEEDYQSCRTNKIR